MPWNDDEGGFVSTWKDVRNSMETGDDLNKIPEGMQVVPVVGVSFIEDYPTNLHRLAIVHSHRRSEIEVALVRNPDNPYDSNAVEVRYMGYMTGHLPKDVAAQVAPLLDAGETITAMVFQVRISPDNLNNPGLDVLIDGWTYASRNG